MKKDGATDRTCPQCGLTNLPTAERCECGYSFVTGTGGKLPPTTREIWRRRLRDGFVPVALLAVTLAVFWNAEGHDRRTIPMLVFDSPLLNTLTLFVACVLPLPALVLIVSRWRGIVCGVVATLVGLVMPCGLLFAGLVALFGSRDWTREQDGSFQRLRSLRVGGYEVVTYRTDGGATTSYGIIVQQEWPLMPGLRVVRMIYQYSRASDAIVEVLGPDAVVVIPDSDGGANKPGPRTIHLEPLTNWHVPPAT